MPLGLPSAVGSLAVAAAASGAVTMPQALAATSVVASDSHSAVPVRPLATETSSGALDPVDAAGDSLTAESTQTAKTVNAALVEAERKDAAERAARAERERKKWVLPLTSSYRLSAGFGAAGRLWSSRHTGQDLATAYGSSVRSMSSGEIVFAGYDGPYGNKVVIHHWDGTETWYCHLSRILRRSGDVKPGTEIGKVGTTGNSTGPHLHIEVHPHGGDAVNPRTWLANHGLNL